MGRGGKGGRQGGREGAGKEKEKKKKKEKKKLGIIKSGVKGSSQGGVKSMKL